MAWKVCCYCYRWWVIRSIRGCHSIQSTAITDFSPISFYEVYILAETRDGCGNGEGDGDATVLG